MIAFVIAFLKGTKGQAYRTLSGCFGSVGWGVSAWFVSFIVLASFLQPVGQTGFWIAFVASLVVAVVAGACGFRYEWTKFKGEYR